MWLVFADAKVAAAQTFIFIDDCYLFCALQDAQEFRQAVAATQLFDGLTGQKLNIAKSAGWGTSKEARAWLAAGILLS